MPASEYRRTVAGVLSSVLALSLSAACSLALVTWSVQDPSLNHVIMVTGRSSNRHCER